MAKTGRDSLDWSIEENVPEDKCGFTVKFPKDQSFPGSVTCWRGSWRDHDQCIWHADVANKPAQELADDRTAAWERFDGAVLRAAELRDDINFAECVFTGADFTDTYLRRADLTGAYLQSATLTGADLGGANCSRAFFLGADITDSFLTGTEFTDAVLAQADLTKANLEGADLTNASLQDANLTSVKLLSTRLDGIQLNAATKFGGPSKHEEKSDRNATGAIPFADLRVTPHRAFGRPDTNPDPLRHAEVQYRTTQRLLREHDLREQPEFAIREKHARRKRALAERDYWTWLKLAFYRWPLGYGERVRNVLATSAVTIVGFALAYPFVGGMEASTGETTPYAFGNVTPAVGVPEWVEILGANLYFSAVTFSTLGYGDIQPASPAAQALASIESLLGALLMAFLVFVLGRRTTW